MSQSVIPDRSPIFVQAMWRTGSTYVWKKFREQREYRAYYEPLHECYRWPREQVQSVCGPDERAALRHPAVEDYYCSEMPFTPAGGVEYFQKELSYQRYCLQESEEDADLRRYVGNLIDHAARQGQRAVLQFNRGLLRAGWLERNFSPIQILVLRRPLNIWKSFARFPGHGFHAYVCTILGQNQHKSPLELLPKWLAIPCRLGDTFEQEYQFYQPFAAANLHRLYPSFFDFNLVATLHAARYADCILNLDEISGNTAVREAARERLRELGMEMPLDDCAVPDYPDEPGDDEWSAYEEFSVEYLAGTLPPQLSLTREKTDQHRPLLGEYFNRLFAVFTQGGESAAESAPMAAAERAEASQHKHAVSIGLFENHQFQAAATLLGSALAQRATGALWNDWATAQVACSRPILAELGFAQALRSEPAYRDAAASLGVLHFEGGWYREALPMLIEAELAADEQTRPMISQMVNQAREALGLVVAATPQARPKGLTIFLTGLSGAGKSTIAGALMARLSAHGRQPVSLLDGDEVRRFLSSELGYSKQHRDLNVRRIGFVATQIARSGGIAICACIAPYDQVRQEVRAMAEREGSFLLVHVATPLALCEQRDVKGLYARARAGELTGFTGITDPYEPPGDAELIIDTATMSVEDATEAILALIARRGHFVAGAALASEEVLVGAR